MYDLCKIALVDGYLKRYLKSYIGATILLLAFDKLLDKVLSETKGKDRPKFDHLHLERAYESISKVITKFFGFNKFIFLQIFG